MSYHPSIPQANDDPTVSQGQLLDNFGTLNTDFAINHVAFTAGGNAGFHKIVQFTNNRLDGLAGTKRDNFWIDLAQIRFHDLSGSDGHFAENLIATVHVDRHNIADQQVVALA